MKLHEPVVVFSFVADFPLSASADGKCPVCWDHYRKAPIGVRLCRPHGRRESAEVERASRIISYFASKPGPACRGIAGEASGPVIRGLRLLVENAFEVCLKRALLCLPCRLARFV